MSLPTYYSYHTGMKRNDDQVWRRSSDGEEVKLEGWLPGNVLNGRDFLFWWFDDDSYRNEIWNGFDRSLYFICEY